jgi:hypothetical protein
LSASLGNSPSFGWRSIWHARDLLSQGLLWRVGNGQSIKIWGDRWLPSPLTCKVQSCRLILDSNSLVASLIDPLSKSWKLDLIQRVFKDEEALVVANIPLSPMLP